MKNIIADSNVWYSLANNNKNVEELVTKNGRLCATPINLLEIAKGINDDNTFIKRKKAALAILKFAKRYIRSNEAYLASYWGLNSKENINWKEGFATIAKANSLQDLIYGYNDYEDIVFRKQNIPLLQDWHSYQYDDYKQKVMKSINEIMPNYLIRIQNGRSIPKISDKQELGFFNSIKFTEASLLSTFYRAKLVCSVNNITGCPTKPNFHKKNEAYGKVKAYILAYAEFLKYLCEFGAKPDDNDLGDHELFLYLQNKNWILATADHKWIKIGQKACPANILDLSDYIEPHA